ncbi:MAG: polysaccharide deacetylase family protein [Clostridia bacterium]|nr:polysaccharide deacetylase family protein [Clostridia bacterium]
MYWQNKFNKALTFSFDDGITQDIRFIEILNKYGLKSTFNLNSGLFGNKGIVNVKKDGEIIQIPHNKVHAEDIKKIYSGHEVAVHTLTHPYLVNEDDSCIIWQVEEDRKILSNLCGYEVVGMAYPNADPNHDERVIKVIKENTGVKYSRTIRKNFSFDLQENLLSFDPTAHIGNKKELFELAEKFINMKNPTKPQLFYIWGHTYEFDYANGGVDWQVIEDFCKLVSNKEDIYYCTNKEAFKIEE